MEVSSMKISKVFSSGGDIHFFLPHFQREYAWEKENWDTLIKDMLTIYDNYDPLNEPEHFMGALVVIGDGNRSGTIPAFKLVDGQQRLTTISLILCALARLVDESNPVLARKIRRLVENPDETGVVRYKLVPTAKNGDRETYFAVVDGEDVEKNESRISVAFDFFYRHLRTRLTVGDIDPERLFLVIANCMHVVFINLNQAERPYEIFESLNAKGKALTEPDLIRNYIAMKLPNKEQTEVFEKHWTKIEKLLSESRTVSRIGELTAFIRHYLAFRSNMLPNMNHVYARFRDRMEKNFSTVQAFVGEMQTLHRFADYYDKLLRPDHEQDVQVRMLLKRLNILESATAYPFMLAMYDSWAQGRISREDFIAGLTVIENYMMRRYLAGEQTQYTPKMFATLEREIQYAHFVESLRKALLSKNYPSDSRIRQALPTAPLYDTRRPQRLVLFLETINRYLSKDRGGYTVLDGEATIEHIMPQKLSDDWKRELGNGWDETHRELLHTIGNLTLVTRDWNSSLSNSVFVSKKRRLQAHALHLNCDYDWESVDRWDADSIRRRADTLIDITLQIWETFGEPPTVRNISGEKPRAITISGDIEVVKSWRDVAIQMSEFAAGFLDDFNQIAESMPAYFSFEERPNTVRLKNGWYLYVKLSANSVLSLCEQLASFCGLTSEDWEISLAGG